MKELIHTATREGEIPTHVFAVDRATANSILRNEIVSILKKDERLMDVVTEPGFTVNLGIKNNVVYVVSSNTDPEEPHASNIKEEGSTLGFFATESAAIKSANDL